MDVDCKESVSYPSSEKEEGKFRDEEPSAPESISISCWACVRAEVVSASERACSAGESGRWGEWDFEQLVFGEEVRFDVAGCSGWD